MTAIAETAEAEVKFIDFDEDFQLKLVALLVRSDLFARRTDGLIKPEYFESRADAALSSLALSHFDRYKQAPKDAAIIVAGLKDALRRGTIRSDMVDEIKDKIKIVFSPGMDVVSCVDFAVDQVGTFARHQAITAAMLQAFDHLEKHNTVKVQELLEKAFKVGPRPDSVPYDYWSEAESRTEFRRAVKSGEIKPLGISTGIPAIDKLLFHRGWGIKELTVFMAGAKKGKSFTLWDFAKLISLQGKNVLGITLEVSKDVLSTRLDASVSDVPIDEIEGSIFSVLEAVRAARDKRLPGKFLLHEFPSGSFRPMDLQNLIDQYKSEGIKFDAIVIDYLDIMSPNRWVNDPQENSRSVWVDCRGIAQTEEVVMLSATQTNREGHKSVTAKAEHAAEDFNKIRTADLVISLNATEEEMAKGEARMFFAASRNQKGEFAVRIKRDLSRGHAVKEVIGFE
jgi:replicative DNA helicase